jgi:hypothetical protein
VLQYVVLPMCAATSEAHDACMTSTNTFDLHHRIAEDRSIAFESAAARNRLVRDGRPGWWTIFRRRGPA